MESNAGPPYPCRENLKAPYQERDQPNSQNHTSTYPPPMHSTIDDVAPPTPTRSIKFELLRGEASTKLNTSSTTGRHKSRLYLSPANVLCHRRKPKRQPEFGNRLHQHHTSTYPPPIHSAIDEGPNQHEFIRLPIPRQDTHEHQDVRNAGLASGR